MTPSTTPPRYLPPTLPDAEEAPGVQRRTIAYYLKARGAPVLRKEGDTLMELLGIVREANTRSPDNPIKAALYREDEVTTLEGATEVKHILLATWGGGANTRKFAQLLSQEDDAELGRGDHHDPDTLPDDAELL